MTNKMMHCTTETNNKNKVDQLPEQGDPLKPPGGNFREGGPGRKYSQSYAFWIVASKCLTRYREYVEN